MTGHQREEPGSNFLASLTLGIYIHWWVLPWAFSSPGQTVSVLSPLLSSCSRHLTTLASLCSSLSMTPVLHMAVPVNRSIRWGWPTHAAQTHQELPHWQPLVRVVTPIPSPGLFPWSSSQGKDPTHCLMSASNQSDCLAVPAVLSYEIFF